MSVTDDFRDMLFLLEKHGVRYLVVGGYAFAFHAIPRYTKDLDLFLDSSPGNVTRANEALDEFGAPVSLDIEDPGEILQIGVEPNRIDLIRRIGPLDFDVAWSKRVRAPYGDVEANWVGLEALIESKQIADRPRDREDVAVLETILKTK